MIEVKGDLFAEECGTNEGLVHCVGKDFIMGAGIAKEFRSRFGRVDELLAQKVCVGQVAFISSPNKVYYLVTKESSYGKPTYQTLGSCLENLNKLCIEHGIKKLKMPRIGCGLDRLNWGIVKEMIENTLKETEIVVYYL